MTVTVFWLLIKWCPNHYVDNQLRWFVLYGLGPTLVEREWRYRPANVKVIIHGQHLAWITLSSHPCTMATLMTVQHK